MKLKTLIAMAAIVMFVACGSPYRASDVNGVVVSSDVRYSFSSQYPDATEVIWSSYDPNIVILNDWELSEWPILDAADYTVKFKMDDENYYAWYDKDGNWIGSAYAVNDYTTLPSPVNITISSQFPGYSITSVNREFKKDRIAYEVVLKKDDLKVVALIDTQGNIIKQKTK